MFKLTPNPGLLPTKEAPGEGDEIRLSIISLPPYKDFHVSIRNPKHRHHGRFIALRDSATEAMNGRCWSHSAITLWLIIYAPKLDLNKNLNDYLSGVMDTLDGSHGESFTYLPICFQDDCQVNFARVQFFNSDEARYEVRIQFHSEIG